MIKMALRHFSNFSTKNNFWNTFIKFSFTTSQYDWKKPIENPSGPGAIFNHLPHQSINLCFLGPLQPRNTVLINGLKGWPIKLWPSCHLLDKQLLEKTSNMLFNHRNFHTNSYIYVQHLNGISFPMGVRNSYVKIPCFDVLLSTTMLGNFFCHEISSNEVAF